ncbi:hypothetical protein PVAND_009186 [Polypedilum vanderplanki]|uniref:Uncharacterized protein n=1 Tax=Polypedilum vanderplanki TaxID=319348 RepID=A0A9J6CC43_POLVA|nr:hypothetical protein PVAND_009186 [Polypedilum vanderplanki]
MPFSASKAIHSVKASKMSAQINNTSIEDTSKSSHDTSNLSKSNEIPPKRITTPLELQPNSDKADIARKQLENLCKKPRKKSSPTTSDNENINITSSSTDIAIETSISTPISEVLYTGKPTMNNLSSAILDKEELENEIRKKIAKTETQLPTVKKIAIGEIEIPQELILSEISSPGCNSKISDENATQLDGQELIDILEGKAEEEEGEMFEVYGENGMFIVKSDNKSDQNQTTTSYEIIATEDEKMAATKQKLLEREIAMRQIASMPTRKNRKLKQNPTSVVTNASVVPKPQPTLAQSLAMDWSDREDDEVILELENIEETNEEPKIKILNMTILNESTVESPRVAPKLPVAVASVKNEPKILNINAPQKLNPPKILNINAPQTSDNEDATPRRGRIIKKKTIWDPSESRSSPQPQSKLPISLPSTITIKKLTKESISKTQAAASSSSPSVVTLKTKPVIENQQLHARKGKKKSEIDKLFQDEGAVNMIYSLERQNNNQDVPEIKVSVDQKSLIDKSEEKSTLMVKTKTIKQTIMKQSTSPPEIKTPTRPQRYKRDLTPNMPEGDAEKKSSPEKTEKAVIITKVQKPILTGRKKKIDDTWDYVRRAQTTCDDAMIIRRHSSSSYSSSATSPRRLSLDQCISDSIDDPNKLTDQKSAFKFTKPQEKKTPESQQKDLKSCVGGLVEELRNTISSKLAKGKNLQTGKGKKRSAAVVQNQDSPPVKQRLSERRSYGAGEKEYKITKADGIAHIVINTNPLTINLLSEMKSVLNQLENDDNCKVVLITPSESFSQGLDYSTLIQTTVDKRKQSASDLVTAVKNFLISLAAFPKILVCGLKGSTSGIAVTMLPLFDLAIGDSSTKFSLPHGRIGSNPEGISLLQKSTKINPNAITEMFYLNEEINVNLALKYGLVSKVPKNMEEEAKEICNKIASLSSQALESTKNILTEDFLMSIDQHLAKEMKILQQQWISAECQERFKKHVANGKE